MYQLCSYCKVKRHFVHVDRVHYKCSVCWVLEVVSEQEEKEAKDKEILLQRVSHEEELPETD